MRSTAGAWALFDLVRRPWMALRVRVRLTGVRPSLPGGPLLLVANHESFWDGFIVRDVQRALRPGASFHALMLNRELAPRPWLRLLGGIGVTPGSVAAGRRMLRAVEALPGDAVLGYFPQGRIRPTSPRPLGFHVGAAKVCERSMPTTVVPVGIRLVQGRTPRTEAYVSVGPPVEASGGSWVSAAAMEDAVTAEVDAIDAFLAEYGEDAPEAWPAPGGRLERAVPSWLSDPVSNWTSRN